MSKSSEIPAESPNDGAQHPVRLFAVCLVVLTLTFACTVAGYARYGRGLLDRLEDADPTTVLMTGMQREREGDRAQAIALYRKAAHLGLDSPGSRENVRRRLQSLLAEQGRIPGYREANDDSRLANGGFEEAGTAGWTVEGTSDALLERETIEPFRGHASLRVTLPHATSWAIRQEATVLPGNAYRLSGWVRIQGCIQNVRLAVKAPDGRTLAESTPVTGECDWTQLAVAFAAPQYTNGVRVELYVDGGPCTFGLDGFVLAREAPPETQIL